MVSAEEDDRMVQRVGSKNWVWPATTVRIEELRESTLKTQHATGLILLVALGISCVTKPQTGIIAAQWEPKAAGDPSEHVMFVWESRNSIDGIIRVQLGPGGERYAGQYIRVTGETKQTIVEPIIGGWGPIWSGYGQGAGFEGDPGIDPWYWGTGQNWNTGGYGTAYASFQGFVMTYSGKVVATLYGKGDHSMRCRFTLDEPNQGLLGGGKGQCQTSDGGKVEANF